MGIAATAIVGIVGATSSWLISRGDHASQRALALDARVYDRRADAYLAALIRIEEQRHQILDEFGTVGPLPQANSLLMAHGADAGVYAGVAAFGSADAVHAYDALRSIVRIVYDDELYAVTSVRGGYVGQAKQSYGAAWKKLHASLGQHGGALEAQEHAFIAIVKGELS